MKIKIAKTVSEEMEVTLPLFLSDKYSTHVTKITEEVIVKVYNNSIFIQRKEDSEHYYSDEIVKLLNYNSISESEFNEIFHKALEKIQEIANIPSLQNVEI